MIGFAVLNANQSASAVSAKIYPLLTSSIASFHFLLLKSRYHFTH